MMIGLFLIIATCLASVAYSFLFRNNHFSIDSNIEHIKLNNNRVHSHMGNGIEADYHNDMTHPIHSIKHVTFVSSNKNKIKEVKMILGEEFPWDLQTMDIDLHELQATPIEVSRHKCQQAVELCNGPVIVEDTSLCFNALNGLPGPYIKWFYEAIGNEGLIKLLQGFDDRTAYAQCVLSFCKGRGQEVLTFVGSTEGVIVREVTGPSGFGWDPIFIPIGAETTFAQMGIEQKNKLSHRYRAFRELKYHFTKRSGS